MNTPDFNEKDQSSPPPASVGDPAAEEVVEIPASPADEESQSVGSGLLPKVLGILGLSLVAVLGYGSANEWFGLLASKDAEEQPADDEVSNELSPDIEAAASNAVPLDAKDATSLVEDLPPLDPILADQSADIIEECKRVATHLFGVMPNTLEAKEMLARTEYEFGDTAKAQKLWEDILKQNPQFLYALRGLGDLATAEGKLREAVEYYKKAAEYAPQSVTRKITLGVAMTQAAQLDESKAILLKALEQSPEHGGAMAALGQVLLLQKDFEGAKQQLESALAAKIRPENLPALHLGLVRAHQRLGDKERAKQHQEEYKKLTSRDSNVSAETKQYDDLAAIRQDVGRFYVDMARVYLAGGTRSPRVLYWSAPVKWMPQTSTADKRSLFSLLPKRNTTKLSAG